MTQTLSSALDRHFGVYAHALDPDTSELPGVRMSATHAHHIRAGGAGVGNGLLLYRNPYQPTLMFLSAKIFGLREAMKGGHNR